MSNNHGGAMTLPGAKSDNLAKLFFGRFLATIHRLGLAFPAEIAGPSAERMICIALSPAETVKSS